MKQQSTAANQRRVHRLKLLSRHPFAVPVFTFIALLAITGLVYLLVRSDKPRVEAQVVIVSHDGAQQTVPSIEPTVGALLQKLNIRLGQGDVVEPSLSTPIKQDDFRVNVYRAVPVKIVDGANSTYTFSAATTPRAIARQTGSTLYPEDDITATPAENFLKDGAIGEQVTIDRSVPVSVNLYGAQEIIRTHAKTVGELVKERGIKLTSSDQVIPDPSTPVSSSQPVFIARQGMHLESVNQAIAMPVQVIQDSGLAYGTSAVRQQGSPGQRIITYQIDQQGHRSVIQTVTIQDPVTQIVVQGTSLTGIKGDMALAGIAPGDYNYVDYIISHESGWCPTKAQGQYGGCPAYTGYVPSSGGYGLCQSTPGSKMATAGSDWATNPVTQLKWCSGYAHSRYGSWAAAYSHWLAHHNW